MTTTDIRWRRDPALQAVPMGEELVMMGVQQGEYYAVSGVAATLWQALETPRSVDDLCAAVAAEYDVSAPDCRADVEAFLADLQAKGMASPE